VYVDALSLEAARPYLRHDYEPDANHPWVRLETNQDIEQRLRDHMPPSWQAANNCLGISSSRNIMRIIAWLWLLGPEYDSLGAVLEDWDRYRYYGKPQLRAVCEHFGIDWISLDNGVWCSDPTDETKLTASDVHALIPPD